ncbi:MAG: isopentenyl phosphate kinase [Anaerolineae bacterium]
MGELTDGIAAMLQFVKLGGSLITDKARAYTARHEVIQRLADEVHRSLDADPDMRLLMGHGSGSFGHWAAEPYRTHEGVSTAAEWRGYAEVAAAAARLNRLVADAFLGAGVPVVSLQPSASARCDDGELVYVHTRPIHEALARGLVPLVYGDVAFDDVRGGTIASTEDLFVYLADELLPHRVLLLSRVPGVLDSDGEIIPQVTLADMPRVRQALSGSWAVDVTGGMVDKVETMLRLVQRHPQTTVDILSGTHPGLLTRSLLDPELAAGTRICSAAPER